MIPVVTIVTEYIPLECTHSLTIKTCSFLGTVLLVHSVSVPSTVLRCDCVYVVLACMNVVYNYEVVKSFPGTVTEEAHM